MSTTYFEPHLFINYGKGGQFYTLRETYEKTVNGRTSVLSFHVMNLSQDPDEAFRAAERYAYENGTLLKTTRDELPNLKDVFNRPKVSKAKLAKQAAAEAYRQRQQVEYLARRSNLENQIRNGIIPFGKHAGCKYAELKEYCQFLHSKKSEFDPNSILGFFINYLEVHHPDMLMVQSEYNDCYIAHRVSTRTEVRGKVMKITHFDSEFGRTYYVSIKDDLTGALVVSRGKWCTELGKIVRVMGTVKEKSIRNGQKQTIINRVKELPSVR